MLTLRNAVENNDYYAAEKAIQRGESVNALGEFYINPGELFKASLLSVATALGHIEIMKILIAHGADVNAKSPNNNITPFMIAARQGQLKALKLLYAHQADINARTSDSNGRWSALDYAAWKNRKEEALYILELPVDLNSKTLSDESSFDIARNYNRELFDAMILKLQKEKIRCSLKLA